MLIKVTFAPKMTKTFVQRLIQNHKAVFQIPYGEKKQNKQVNQVFHSPHMSLESYSLRPDLQSTQS